MNYKFIGSFPVLSTIGKRSFALLLPVSMYHFLVQESYAKKGFHERLHKLKKKIFKVNWKYYNDISLKEVTDLQFLDDGIPVLKV